MKSITDFLFKLTTLHKAMLGVIILAVIVVISMFVAYIFRNITGVMLTAIENTINGNVIITGTYPGIASSITGGHASGIINIPTAPMGLNIKILIL
jgi:flagellar biosynthesis/type III secretory pathway M-ring protein FliF/YscJ